MRRSLVAIAAAVLTAGAPLSAQTAHAYASTRINLHTAPSASARVVATIPRGSAVERGGCAAGWCAVTFGTIAGYASERYLGDGAPTVAPTQPGRSYTNSDGVRVQSPRRSADGSIPAGASAQCRDGTYSFSLHRRGTCSHHGGVSRWLK